MELLNQQLDIGLINLHLTEVTDMQAVFRLSEVLVAVKERVTDV